MSTEPTKQQRGGRARAEILPPARRSEIAREAAQRRWQSGGDHVHHALDVGVANFVRLEIPVRRLRGRNPGDFRHRVHARHENLPERRAVHATCTG